ncbi:TspO/MBR family protein [Nocardioides alcanivorans]|uniref:TspO/MBR family protein n=1 Tax=Nocardioides alcanivorans TaxID=2897352 RepID=UPI001F1EF275|nr:TspO/MBR family protein [Nocardioides alcanivorans]
MEPRALVSSIGLPLSAAALGSLATASGTRSSWYRSLSQPSIQPPAIAFPIVWSVLYVHSAIASGMAQAHMDEAAARSYRRKLALNMTLNAGWCWSFFKGRQIGPSVVVAGALTASSVDLARTAGAAYRPAGGFLTPYAAWTGFATVLNAAIWRRNRSRT